MAKSESKKDNDKGEGEDSKRQKPGVLAKLVKTVSDAKTLLISTVVVIGLLAFSANTVLRVMDEDIIVDSISIPSPVKEFGYTEAIVSQKFLDAIHYIQSGADAPQAARSMLLASQRVNIEIPGSKVTTGFLLELSRVIRGFFKNSTIISGEMLCIGQGEKCNRSGMSMTLRVQGETSKSLKFEKIGDQTDEEYFRTVAQEILIIVDPVQTIAWYYATADDEALTQVAISMIDSTHPKRHWAFLFLGHLDQHKGDDGSALYQYYRALEINPDFLEAHSEIAVVRYAMGEYDKAEVAAKNALMIDPNHVSTLATSAFINISKENYLDAIYHATRAIDLDETSAYPWVALGQAHLYSGDYETALVNMRNALEKLSKPLIAGYAKGDPESEQLIAKLVSNIALALEKLNCHDLSAMAFNLALGIFDRPSEIVDQLKSLQDEAFARHSKAVEENNVQCVDDPV